MLMAFTGLTVATSSRKSSSDKTLNCPFIKRKFQSLVILFNFIYLFIYGCRKAFSVVVSGGYSLISVHGLLIVMASFVMEHEL